MKRIALALSAILLTSPASAEPARCSPSFDYALVPIAWRASPAAPRIPAYAIVPVGPDCGQTCAAVQFWQLGRYYGIYLTENAAHQAVAEYCAGR